MISIRGIVERAVELVRRRLAPVRRLDFQLGASIAGVRVIGGRGLLIDHRCRIQGAGRLVLGQDVRLGFRLGGRPDNAVLLQPRTAEAVIEIGDRTAINNGTEIIARFEVTIGADCLIGQDCMIFDSDFHGLAPERRRENGVSRPVIIGRNVWLGARVIILKGVRIGDDAVVAAGSIVTRDVECGSVVAGNPARTIGRVNG